MTLYTAIDKIRRKDPDTIITLCTERYGFFWSGKARFAAIAITADADNKLVKRITPQPNGFSLYI